MYFGVDIYEMTIYDCDIIWFTAFIYGVESWNSDFINIFGNTVFVV